MATGAMGSLEADFVSLMQSHAKSNQLTRNRIEKAKKEALAGASVVADLFVDSVNGGVQEVFINEKRIELEARALKETVQRFLQQSTQWLTLFQTFDSALKEIGDFENWIKVMEYDCQSIGGALTHVASRGGTSR